MNNNVLVVIGILFVVGLGAYWLMGRQPEPVVAPSEPEVLEDTVLTEQEEWNPENINVTIDLNPVQGGEEDQTGMARFMEIAEGIEVVVEVLGYETTEPQPAHIHMGTCPGVGEVKYPLENLVGGTSTTVLTGVTLEQLRSELPLTLNVHKSASEASVYTACGELVL